MRKSPLADRILYLGPNTSFLEAAQGVIYKLLPSLEFLAGLDLTAQVLQQVSSSDVKVSNAAYFAIFDRSDESMINDYEELLNAFRDEPQGAAGLFHNIIQGFLTENPLSAKKSWIRTGTIWTSRRASSRIRRFLSTKSSAKSFRPSRIRIAITSPSRVLRGPENPIRSLQ